MVNKLKIFNNFNISNKFKKSIILIGNFDGLHSGHQKLFELAKKYKTKYKSKVGVVTFDPIPVSYTHLTLPTKRIVFAKVNHLTINFFKRFCNRACAVFSFVSSINY